MALITVLIASRRSSLLRKKFSVTLSRSILELQGDSCLILDEAQSKKNITCSRSFGKPVTSFRELLEAVSSYVARACEKARIEKTKAQSVTVYIRSSIFNKEQVYQASKTSDLFYPSNNTITITQVANDLLKKIFKPGVQYKKAGVILCGLIPERNIQLDLFSKNPESNDNLMHVIDKINHRFGSRHIFLGAEGIKSAWIAKSTLKSPCYTTQWKELKKVIANNVIFIA